MDKASVLEAESLLDSLNELESLIRAVESGFIIGKECESPGHFWLLSVGEVRIGIVAESRPIVQKLAHGHCILLDNKVHLFDENWSSKFGFKLDSQVYEVKDRARSLIIVHEVGVKSLSKSGDYEWNINTDLIEDHKFDGDELVLTTETGNARYSLINGKPLH